MLNLETSTAILRLRREGHERKKIARDLGISRNSVRSVLRSGEAEVPSLQRTERLAPHIERIRELFAACKGNRVRVVEELAAEGIEVPYPTLTAFCRRHQIGLKPKQRVGQSVPLRAWPGDAARHFTT